MQSLHDVCVQAHPIAENSSSLGKSTALSAEMLRWRSVLQSEPAVNFYTYEDEEVKSPKSKVQKNVANSSTSTYDQGI